jgi:riboflavin synthase
MFTGIVTDVGEVVSVERRGDTRLVIRTGFNAEDLAIGASVACSGCCLTVVERSAGSFSVDASAETLSRTTLGGWRNGTRVNLERSLRLGDELGGHLMSGHVDGVGEILSIRAEGGSKRFRFRLPRELARFVASKGSIALDGTSLTVNEVEGSEFGVNIIPHTLSVTSWGEAREGDRVNVEIDMLARYVARLAEFSGK